MKYYNKLVRDNIPDIIRQKGESATIRIADEAEYREKLMEKLQEEVDEFLKDKNVEELADISEVVHALAACMGSSPAEVEKIRLQKAEKRGTFSQKIILYEA